MNPIRTVRVDDPTDVLWKRVGALLIDELITVVGAGLLNWVLPDGAGLLGLAAAALAVWVTVFVVVQGLTGATPGKMLTGLRVVDDRGHPVGLGPAFVRSAGWIVDGFPYVLPLTGYAAAAGDKDSQRFGDRWAHTYVVATGSVGKPPFAVATTGDGVTHRLTTRAAYLPPGDVNPLKRPHTDSTAGLSPAPVGAVPMTIEPEYDREIGAYKRWDPSRAQWLVFDEVEGQWRVAVIPNEATTPRLAE